MNLGLQLALGGLRKRGGWTGDLITESSFIVAREQSITVNEKARIDLQMKISTDNRPNPMGVVIDLITDSTFYGIDNPVWECSFWTAFGDEGATLQNVGSEFGRNNANLAQGGVVGHVYGDEGIFTAVSMCKHHATGKLGFAVHTFTTLNADTFYAGTQTICLDPSGAFTGAPTGSLQYTEWSSAKAAMLAKGENARFLIARDQTVVADDFNFYVKKGCQYGGFGTGLDPKITFSRPPADGGKKLFYAQYWRHPSEDSIIFELNIESNYDVETGVGEDFSVTPIAGDGSIGVTVWRTSLSGVGIGINISDDGSNLTSNVLIQDNSITNWQNYGVFGGYRLAVFQGNSIKQSNLALTGLKGAKDKYFQLFDGDGVTTSRVLTDIYIDNNPSELHVFDYEPPLSGDSGGVYTELVSGVDYTFTLGTDATSTTASDGTHQIDLTVATANGHKLYVHYSYYPWHGPIRMGKYDSIGVIQNEMRSRNGWSSDGKGHQPNLRLGSNGEASDVCFVMNNDFDGGFQNIAIGPANSDTRQFPCLPMVFAYNILRGNSYTRSSITLGRTNVLFKNNIGIREDAQSVLGAYDAFIEYGRNEASESDLDVFPVLSVNNSVINLTTTANTPANTVILKSVDTPFPLVSDINNLLYHQDRPTTWPVNYDPLDSSEYYRPQDGSPALNTGTQNQYVWDDISGKLIDGNYSFGAYATADSSVFELTFNATNSARVTFPLITLTSNQKLQLTFSAAPSGGVRRFLIDRDSGAAAGNRAPLEFDENDMLAYLGDKFSDVKFDGVSTGLGDDISAYLDEQEHVILATVTSGQTAEFGTLGCSYVNSLFFDGIIKNVKWLDTDDTPLFELALNSGSITTEDFTTGDRVATFVNVVEGDWSAV